MPSLLISTNARMAISSIRANKLRSFLTMLGIVIGVASVIMMISLGEGVRRQVIVTNQGGNKNLVTVRSGRIASRNQDGQLTDVNLLASFTTNSLTDRDYESLKKLPEASVVVPLATISGLPATFEGNTYSQATVIATNDRLPSVIGQKVAYGSFFAADLSSRNVVVIGKRVAEELFKENVPLGSLLRLRNQDFIVGGVFEEFGTNPLSQVTDLNKAVFIDYNTARSLSSTYPAIYQFLLLPNNNVDPEKLVSAVHQQLLNNHGQQVDFTVLRSSETDAIARGTVSIATSFVAGIAAISLLVGGIGIMNIMFVNVTERTREIGVRKSLGATNRQIYSQFLIEATIISIIGGTIGLAIAGLGNLLLRITGDLQPAVTWQIVALAVGVSAIVGIIFGTVPAVKAARKDPIESLRYE